MAHADPDTLLLQFSEFLSRKIGLHFPPTRCNDLLRGMEHAARELGYSNIQTCMRGLMKAPIHKKEIETLAKHLSVGETYFFRERQVFDILQNHVLPPLIRTRRQSGQYLRIWSAGCASGEEAYSLAILLQRMIPDFNQWNILILATDINPQVLEKAAAGIYGSWSFRSAPSWLQKEYFTPAGKDRYEIDASVRHMVTFSYLNLAEDAYPSLANNTNAMDLVFCRNVLMYFETSLAGEVLKKHHQALIDGGWLVVSPSEIAPTYFANFAAVHFPDAILHQKNPGTTSPVHRDMPQQHDVAPTERRLHERRPPPARRAARPKPEPARAQPHPDFQHAQALYHQGRYVEAIEETTWLLAQDRTNVDAMTLMVRLQANQGALSEALLWCEKIIALNRLNPIGHYLRAAILMEHGRMEEAMLAYKRTLYLDQDFVVAHFALGNLFRRQRRPREAGKHFENALQLLHRHENDDILPESDGITAGRLAEIIRHDMAQRNEMA